MADYIYLLENRLSSAQRDALNAVRGIAREKGLTVFLVGGAVRDLTSGSPVRDLDLVVQGDALKLKKEVEKAGGVTAGESALGQALFVRFPGGVRMEIGSTLSAAYPKPGKPVMSAATILDDLRRRDFTANAMALSLNEGSYGLLMDPLNGVADIENRELRLVSNYGFIEDPIRMVRAVRLMARLGWQMDEKTQARYETGKEEGYISAASPFQLGYEAEEIVHEEDPLRVLKRLESEGWMKVLAPAWTTAKVNVAELEKMRESQTQLQMQGIHPDPAVGNFPLLTAKMSSAEVAALKKSFPRQGFVKEIESLEAEAKDFAAQLTAKTAASPSEAWKLLHSAKPEAVLAVAYSSKNAAIQAKFKSFYSEWPKVRQRVPYALLQEMRITLELPGYEELIETLVFQLMDGKLESVEEMKAFLEPYSPPAPPPTIHVRRPRAAKKDSKAAKGRLKRAVSEDDGDLDSVSSDSDSDLDSDSDSDSEEGLDLEDLDDKDLGEADLDDQDETDAAASEPAERTRPVKKAPNPPAPPPRIAVPAPSVSAKTASVKTAPPAPTAASPAAKKAAAKPAAAAVKPAVKTVAKTVANSATKAATKTATKTASKPPVKKIVPAKKVVVAKKAAPLKKAAPVKKPAPVTKAVAAKKVAAKPAAAAKAPVVSKKVAPKKAVAKKVATSKAVPAKKTVVKKAVPAKKLTPVKAKPSAKPSKTVAKKRR